LLGKFDLAMLIPLKLVRDQPLQQQLYEQLRDLIVSARLAGGTRMPSTRMLADQFSVSRMTVLLTYERLIAELYLTAVPAKGTFVTRTAVPQPLLPAKRPTTEPVAIAALPGRPDPRLFPAGRWRALIRDALDCLGASLAADHHDGDPALRGAIAHWLSTSRGLATGPDRIILANGRQHALHIAAHLLLGPGLRAVIESPCDPRAEALIASTGATVIRLPVDQDGIRTDLLPEGPAAMALVTPEHQRPLGAVMSEARRRSLLGWAERCGAAVVADDVDGELRFEAVNSPALMSLDRGIRVIHLGGFAISLGPGVQLAYLAMPAAMIVAGRVASRLIDDHVGRLEAAALTAMLEGGAYARHLHQLRKVYLGRRDSLIRSLRRHFGADIRVEGQTGGLHFIWHLPQHLGCAAAVAEAARQHGLDAVRLRDHAVLLGFGVPDESHIDTGVGRLAEALSLIPVAE
jgi:GntR family transcriptional regulator / MocR family aminotransferase